MRPSLRDPADEERLQRDGYVVLENFLSADDVERAAALFRDCDSPLHRQPFGASVLSDDLEYRAAVDRGLKDIVAAKIERTFNDFRHCFSNFVVKAPQHGGDAGLVPVHQDISFVDEERHQSLGIWAPLDDVSPENGCLLVAPGSHLWNSGPRAAKVPHPYRELDRLFHEKFLRPVPMRQGSVMIFSQKLFHASLPNRSGRTRVAVGGLFVPREAELYCYYAASSTPKLLEMFEIDDLFYTRNVYGARPDGAAAKTIRYWFDRIPGLASTR